MAQKVRVLMIDDLTGQEGDDVTTVEFSYKGQGYEIDLSAKNGEALDKALAKYIEKAREVRAPAASGRGGRRRRSPEGRTPLSRAKSADVREWAKANGLDLKDRGRVPADVVAQYEAAHA